MLKPTLAGCAFLLLSMGNCGAQDSPVCISGMVMDDSKKPVGRADVIVVDRERQTRIEAKTNGDGQFHVWHSPFAAVDVRVIPPLAAGLAQVSLCKVPAEDGQRLLLSAKKGFQVHGRVLRQGKPLKGLLVVASGDDDTVHGGGETITDSHGRFYLVLTPGEKDIEVRQTRGSQPQVMAHGHASITADGSLPDISISSDLAEQP